jgi:non-ribosomal peptide synthetase component F
LAPASFINKHRITVWFSVPSLVTIMQKNRFLKPGSMPTLRWSLFCGEGLPQSAAEAWQEAAPNSVLENLYGPTELTIACSTYRWDPIASPQECVNGLVPIGRIYEGLEAVVVDEEQHILPAGAKGELCVTGPQMFGGYWQRPDLTEVQIITHATRNGRVARYYRTGDIVQLNANGNYVYYGRRDYQIKLNGYRIELTEIEAMLRSLGCAEAVALPWPEQNPETIVAFVSGIEDGAQACEALRQRLPAYMIPSRIEVLAAMPLTPNGKVDRNTLKQEMRREADNKSRAVTS